MALDAAEQMRVAVVQDVARLHYAVPIALQRQGLLERAFCDWYSRPWSLSRTAARLVRMVNGDLGRRMLDRYAPELDSRRVITNWPLTWHFHKGRKRFRTDFEHSQSIHRMQAEWIRRKGLGRAGAMFGFIRQVDPGLFEWARKQGVTTLGDQMIAPYAWEVAEETKQKERYPEFQGGKSRPGDMAWKTLEEQTWPQLDHITCASGYVRDGIVAQGIAAEKITVNPYPIDTNHFPYVDRSGRKGPVVVGFVGAVNLRKGTPYFFEVAKRFDPAKVKFVMVGPVLVNPAAAAKYQGHVELPGARPRSEIPSWLQRFDIYFFPSTCEGSAGSITEAMASGLPVVTSPNSGSVVEHGTSGYIFEYDAIDAFTEAIGRLAEDGDLRLAFGRRGRAQAEAQGIDRFGAIFAEMLREIVKSRPQPRA